MLALRVLAEIEHPKYDGREYLLARRSIRSGFHRDGEYHLDWYKQLETTRAVNELSFAEPNNILALEHYFFSLDHDIDLVETINIAIRRFKLDPDCGRDWHFRINDIRFALQSLHENADKGMIPGADLSKAELESVTKRSWDAINDIYSYAYATSKDSLKLYYAYQKIEEHSLLMFQEKRDRMMLYLDEEPFEIVNKWEEDVLQDLEQLYSSNSITNPVHELSMICNDYSIALGLAMHCVSLIETLTAGKPSSSKRESASIFEASMTLLLALTRDCDELEQVRYYIHNVIMLNVCVKDERKEIAKRFLEVLDSWTSVRSSAEYYIMRAYALMNDESSRSFELALTLDVKSIAHALLLAKRLTRHGYRDAARRVLVESQRVADTLDLFATVQSSNFLRESGFDDFVDKSPQDDLYVDDLIHAYEMIDRGDNIAFWEGARTKVVPLN